ncbi:MAG: SusF/SusE family outer membrane protein [Prevotella sp.]|nr:SusF/SusE family outer membrane protein [Prevotella sp.]
MKRILKYGMYALLALLAPTTFQSCNDDKDIVVITEELPLKVDHLYMVGDATPAGWAIDNPTEMTKDADNKFVFTYHGKLNTGEVKFPLTKGDWGATFIYAPAAGTEINANGVASKDIDIRKGGDDNKWKVTETGIYTLSLNLKERTITAVYEGAEPVKPIVSEWLSFIGSATPWGWESGKLEAGVKDGTAKFQKTSDSPLQFTYEGHLNAGEFKVAYDKTDIPGWGNYIQAPEADVTVSHEGVAKKGMVIGGADNKWKVTEAGTYKLIFDLTNHTITVASFTADPAEEPAPAKDPWATGTLYMLGEAANGWSIGDALAFTKSADNLFVYEGQLKAATFKLMATNEGGFGTDDKDWFYAPENGVVIDENGVAKSEVVYGNGNAADNQWKVAKAGKYRLTLDMKAHTIKAEYLGE